MPQKIKLTVSPQVRAKLQHNRSNDGNTSQLSFYVKPDFAAKINQLAQRNQRSVSSVLAEMVEFAMQSLEDGDTELEPTPSNMHPLPANSPLSYNDFAPAKQTTIRAKITTPPLTDTERANKTLGTNLQSWAEPKARRRMDKNGNIWEEVEE